MPSPIGHMLAGLAVSELQRTNPPGRKLRYALLACAADADVLAGLLDGDPASKHGRATHSLAAAAGVSLAVGLLQRQRGHRLAYSVGGAFVAYGSHLVLDFLGKESSAGMELLWPFSDRRMASRHSWFRTITSRSPRHGFWLGLLSWENAKTVAGEVLALGSVWAAVRAVRGLRGAGGIRLRAPRS